MAAVHGGLWRGRAKFVHALRYSIATTREKTRGRVWSQLRMKPLYFTARQEEEEVPRLTI